MSSFRESGKKIASFPYGDKQSDAHMPLGIPIAPSRLTMPPRQHSMAHHLRRQLANSAVLSLNYENCVVEAGENISTGIRQTAQNLSNEMKDVFSRISKRLALAAEPPFAKIDDLIQHAGLKPCPNRISLDALWFFPGSNSIRAIDEISCAIEDLLPASKDQASLQLLSSALKTHLDHAWCLRRLALSARRSPLKSFPDQPYLFARSTKPQRQGNYQC
ncbi:MAG: hypothetical protein NTW74_14185 [Acidobacteria bacterium]|nr:hypothetical protein [Acidobacteriota bacterium]